MRGLKPQKKFANGGPVQGPGTGISDQVPDEVPEGTYIMPTDSTQAIGQDALAKAGTVPVNLSNGEFKLPPEQVHAVGVQTLDAMKNATHTPAAVQARGLPQAQQATEEPRAFFADGGVVTEEENRRRLVKVPQSMSQRGNNTFGNDPKPSAPAAPPQSAAAPVSHGPLVNTPTNTFPGNRTQGDSGTTGAPVPMGQRPAPTAPFEFGSSGRLAKVPDSIGQHARTPAPAAPVAAAPAVAPMTQAEREAAIAQIPTGGVTAPPPKPAAPPLDLRMQPRGMPSVDMTGALDAAKGIAKAATTNSAPAAPSQTAMYLEDGIDDVANRWSQGNAPAAVGAAVRTGVGTVGMAGIEALDKTVGAAARGAAGFAGGFWDGLVGNEAQAQAQPGTPNTPRTPNPPSPKAGAGDITPTPQDQLAKQLGGMDKHHADNVQKQLAAAAPAQAQAAPAAAAQEVAPGVFRTGNSFSDTAAGAVAGAAPRGLPTPQNMAAADALAKQSQTASVGRVASAMSQPASGGVRAPTVAHSGNDWHARQALSRAQAAANGIYRTKGEKAAAVAAYMQALQGDQAARGGQATADVEAMRQSAHLQGLQMQQEGETQRAGMREAGENSRSASRNALEGSRLDSENQVRGLTIRQGQRMEKLHERYAAAKTDEERAAIAQEVRALNGEKAESPWKISVTPTTKNADGTTSMGSVIRYNQQTGEVNAVDVTGSRGLPAAKDNPDAVAIANDTSLTLEQRRAKLNAMGYN